MAMKENPLLTEGQWGFREHWPDNINGPVFDLIHGDIHVAQVWKDEDEWKFTLRQTGTVAHSLAFLLQILSMLADRMRAVEDEHGRRIQLTALSAGGDPVPGAGAIRRLLDALATPSPEASAVRWGEDQNSA